MDFQAPAPGVVYALRPDRDMQASLSTCGSPFDTILLLATDLADRKTYKCNDDDRSCASNPTNSRLDVWMKAQETYYIVVSGYNGAAGAFNLTISCTSC